MLILIKSCIIFMNIIHLKSSDKSKISCKTYMKRIMLLCNMTNICDKFVLNYTLTKTDIAVIIKCIIQNR